MIHLSTVGRITGRPHTIEIWFTHSTSSIYLLSGGERSDWVRNLTHTPTVRVQAGGGVYPGVGRLVTDPDEDRLARDAVHDEYVVRYRGDVTGWREMAPLIAIDLDPST